MKISKMFTLIVVSVLVAILLASALKSFLRVDDSALADVTTMQRINEQTLNAPTIATKNYLPIIFLNSATAGGAWLLAGNAGTSAANDFLGTTDGVTLTLRVSNTIGWRLGPNYGGVVPNVIGGIMSNTVTYGVVGAFIGGGGNVSYPHRVTDGFGTIGGGFGNQAGNNNANVGDAVYATVVGGASNTASGTFAFVGGGNNNTAGANFAVVGGGVSNSATGAGSFIGGGGFDGSTAKANQALAGASTIGGGMGNVISATGTYATIAGGSTNTVNNANATIGGGNMNTALGYAATIGGGLANTSNAYYSFVGGGIGNSALGYAATVGGGSGNSASDYYATVGGGSNNWATVTGTVIAGGGSNWAKAKYAVIGGGSNNTTGVNATYALIGGGRNNTVTEDYSTIGGGTGNTITNTGNYAFIGGGYYNTASNSGAAVGGGRVNIASGNYATVGGGDTNLASGDYTSVSGGQDNTANSMASFVGGGNLNLASGLTSTIGGGYHNTASATGATVSGGKNNLADANGATVGGGSTNTADGNDATVPGGRNNHAQGIASFAAGAYAVATNDGAFVWSDNSSVSNFATTADYQFIIRAINGVGVGTNSPDTQLHVVKSANGSGNVPADNVALLENTNTGNSADVLALKIGGTITPTTSNNYITFLNGNNNSMGAIQGNGTTGVVLASAGNDYAEYLPHANANESFTAGDIVGVFNGRITKATRGAQQLMVISTAPIVLGNDPGETNRANYERVAFIGQAQVRVRGIIRAGDFIVPSGADDGVGIAVSPETISAEQFAQVVGQAWQASSDANVKMINVAVGLARNDPTLARFVQQNQTVEARLAALEQNSSAPNVWLIGGAMLIVGIVLGRRWRA